VKASHGSQLKQIEDLLKTEFEELDVSLKVLGNRVNRWVQVELSGEDQTIAASYINNKIGTCPMNLENAKTQGVLTGYISKIDKEKLQINVDIGVFEPKIVEAAVSLAKLQTQLLQGKTVNLEKILETYGLFEGLPIKIQLTPASETEVVEAELSAAEIQRLHNWQMSLLDRLIVLGSSKADIELVLDRTRLNRDVIDIEELGLFVHALTCKFGTQAAGLIPKIGRYMRYSIFTVFNSKRSFEVLV
jgi:hypothetical protein